MKTSLLAIIMLSMALLSFTKPTFGQTGVNGSRISGSAIDSTSKKKLDFITVNLMVDMRTVVKVEYTKTDGSFVFSGLKPLKYSLVVVGVGYQNKTLEVDLTDSTQREIKLGSIGLTQQVVGLKEVTVSAAKQIIKQEVDRISYDMQADPESKVFSVLDMMRKIPHVSLDADNTIYLKGNTDFKILINGKPSSMVERSYKEILRSMPASSIERIEVITTPPAKYDAEGLAGIINIITNKKVDQGMNGSINLSERFPVGGPGVGGSFTAKFGKWGMSGFTGASIYHTPKTLGSISRHTVGTNPTALTQNDHNQTDNKSGYLGYEVSYELDSLNLFSGQLNINGNQSTGLSGQSSVLNAGNEILQQYDLGNRNKVYGNGMDAALNYQKGFKADKNRLLTFSYRYYRFANDQNANLSISNRIHYELPDYQQENDQNFQEQTAQVDYVYPVRKLTIEAGLKAIMRNNNSDFKYRSWNEQTHAFELNEAFSNQFANTQNVYGAYNTYQYNFKSWGIKAGARIEQTVMKADFISTESEVNQNYFNVIPSASISRKLKNNAGLNLGYTQRIQRPGIYQLNPFVDKSNPTFERTGNPNLRPAIVHDIQLGFNQSKKGSVNFSVGGIFFTDLIFRVSALDPVTNINRISYANTGTARLWQANLNINYPISQRWNFSFNGRTAHGKVTGTVNGASITNSGLMYGIYVSTGYRLEKDWRINASVNVNGPSVNLQGTSNVAVFSSLSVSKDVVKDKLSLSASLNNPFAKYRKNIRYTSGPDFDQRDYTRDYYRGVNLSVNYKFGKLKDGIKKNKRGIRNDDVQNGS